MKFRVDKGNLIPASPEALEYVAKLDSEVDLEPAKAKQRSDPQNNAMHLYFSMLADALNSGGFDMVLVLEEGTPIPWTAKLVKEHIWRKVMIASTGKESTTELTTAECSPIYDIINRHLSATFGVSVLWPAYKDMGR